MSSKYYQLKLLPFTKDVTRQMAAIPVLCGIELIITEWKPSNGFFHWAALKLKRKFVVKNYKGKIFVFRLE